jgi:hypothetical protein
MRYLSSFLTFAMVTNTWAADKDKGYSSQELAKLKTDLIYKLVKDDVSTMPQLNRVMSEYYKKAEGDASWTEGVGTGAGVAGMGAVVGFLLAGFMFSPSDTRDYTCGMWFGGIAALVGAGIGFGVGYEQAHGVAKEKAAKEFKYDVARAVQAVESDPMIQTRMENYARTLVSMLGMETSESPRLAIQLKKDLKVAVQNKKYFHPENSLQTFLGEERFNSLMTKSSSLRGVEDMKLKLEKSKNVLKFGKDKELNLIAKLVEIAKSRSQMSSGLSEAVTKGEALLAK